MPLREKNLRDFWSVPPVVVPPRPVQVLKERQLVGLWHSGDVPILCGFSVPANTLAAGRSAEEERSQEEERADGAHLLGIRQALKSSN